MLYNFTYLLQLELSLSPPFKAEYLSACDKLEKLWQNRKKKQSNKKETNTTDKTEKTQVTRIKANEEIL